MTMENNPTYSSTATTATDSLGKYYTEPLSSGDYYEREFRRITREIDRTLARDYRDYIKATEYNTHKYNIYDNSTATSASYDLYEKIYNTATNDAYYLESDNQRCWLQWAKDGVVSFPAKPVRPADRMRELIRARQSPLVIVSRSVSLPANEREFRARETLRRIIGDKAFQDYLKKGFTSVKAKSGRVYQIFQGHSMTVVWENGEAIKRLCVDLRGGFAPTDSVIMRLILVQTDEADFWAKANEFEAYPDHIQTQGTIDFRPLPEIFAELKARAAA